MRVDEETRSREVTNDDAPQEVPQALSTAGSRLEPAATPLLGAPATSLTSTKGNVESRRRQSSHIYVRRGQWAAVNGSLPAVPDTRGGAAPKGD
jgi:hypothetical protein